MPKTAKVTGIPWPVTLTFMMIVIFLLTLITVSYTVETRQEKYRRYIATIAEINLEKIKNEVRLEKIKNETKISLKKEKKINLKEEKRLNLKNYIVTTYRSVTDETGKSIAESICTLSSKHKIDYNLVVGIIGVESSFNPHVVSKAKARGLMQVRYGVWKDHLGIKNIEELHDINKGIEYGILALLQCRKEAKGNLEKGLQRYNGTKNRRYINKVYKEIGKFTLMKNK